MPSTLLHTESFTMDGIDTFVRVAFLVAFRPRSFTVNGVSQTLKQTFVDPNDGTSWYWTEQSPFINIGSVVAPVFGTLIVVTYESNYSNLVGATSDTTIAAIQGVNDPEPPGPSPDPNPVDSSQDYTPYQPSGIIQRVVDAPGTVGSTQAAAIATGVTRRASLIPLAVSGMTHRPGLKVGMSINIVYPELDLDGDFIVQSLSAKSKDGVDLGHGTSFETSFEAVQLVDAPEQTPSDTSGITQTTSSAYPIYITQPYEAIQTRTAIQPTPIQYEYFTVVLGSGGDLIAGLQLGNTRPVLSSGTLREIYAVAATPPQNQALVIDVMQDGVSIFGDQSLLIPAGSSSIFGVTQFVGYPAAYRMRRGALLTFGALYLTGSGTLVAAQDVTVYGRWAY